MTYRWFLYHESCHCSNFFGIKVPIQLWRAFTVDGLHVLFISISFIKWHKLMQIMHCSSIPGKLKFIRTNLYSHQDHLLHIARPLLNYPLCHIFLLIQSQNIQLQTFVPVLYCKWSSSSLYLTNFIRHILAFLICPHLLIECISLLEILILAYFHITAVQKICRLWHNLSQ